MKPASRTSPNPSWPALIRHSSQKNPAASAPPAVEVSNGSQEPCHHAAAPAPAIASDVPRWVSRSGRKVVRRSIRASSDPKAASGAQAAQSQRAVRVKTSSPAAATVAKTVQRNLAESRAANGADASSGCGHQRSSVPARPAVSAASASASRMASTGEA